MALLLGENNAGEKAKHTIPEVMAKAMKGGLCKKVATGKASDDEKKELVELFTSLTKNKPPMGDEKAWKKRTTALLEAAKKAAAGDAAGPKALGKLANCAACHKEHKG
ncbi:MAG: hypothetical protein L0Y71_05750 [Gemmataceae bacterium]|nr:hypothetical protein [Gemmataceae bacterium]